MWDPPACLPAMWGGGEGFGPIGRFYIYIYTCVCESIIMNFFCFVSLRVGKFLYYHEFFSFCKPQSRKMSLCITVYFVSLLDQLRKVGCSVGRMRFVDQIHACPALSTIK